MAYQKKQKAPKQDKGNILNDPDKRKQFKSALATVTHYYQAIDDHREGAKESIAAIAEEYGVEKKLVRKLATTMYKHNYESVQQENAHFEEIYEIVVEGAKRLQAGVTASNDDDEMDDDIEAKVDQMLNAFNNEHPSSEPLDDNQQ